MTVMTVFNILLFGVSLLVATALKSTHLQLYSLVPPPEQVPIEPNNDTTYFATYLGPEGESYRSSVKMQVPLQDITHYRHTLSYEADYEGIVVAQELRETYKEEIRQLIISIDISNERCPGHSQLVWFSFPALFRIFNSSTTADTTTEVALKPPLEFSGSNLSDSLGLYFDLKQFLSFMRHYESSKRVPLYTLMISTAFYCLKWRMLSVLALGGAFLNVVKLAVEFHCSYNSVSYYIPRNAQLFLQGISNDIQGFSLSAQPIDALTTSLKESMQLTLALTIICLCLLISTVYSEWINVEDYLYLDDFLRRAYLTAMYIFTILDIVSFLTSELLNIPADPQPL